jgi:hypothetical protein
MTTIEKNRKPGDCPDPNDRPEAEEELDEAIADSMVASDPPAVVSKGEATAPPRGKNADRDKDPSAPEKAPPHKKP